MTRHRRTIFLIDDDDDDRMLLKEAIEETVPDVNVIEFLSGIDFVDWITRQAIEPESSLILLDMNMPKMNGIETIIALRAHEHNKHLPVIVTSTSASKELIQQAYACGASAYLTKPDSVIGLAENARAINGFFKVA